MKKARNNITIKNILSVTCFSFIFFLFVSTDTAYAYGITDFLGTMFGGVGTVVDWGLGPVAYMVWGICLAIGGLVAGFGGLLLDTVFNHTVLQMGVYLGPKGVLGLGIVQLWGVVRDILNILFIFGLIYVGINTILDPHKSETQRTLGRIIIAALLINFSLYITQVVVDFTNILSTQVYNQIVASELTKQVTGSKAELGVELGAGSIAGAFLQLTNATTFFGGSDATANMSNTQSLVFALFTLGFLITAGFIFGLAAFLLLTRFIAIIIFMILSPVMFAGWIFPAFEEKQNEWRSQFIHYALFPPALLLMIYLSLMVLNKMQGLFLKKGAGFTDIMKGAGMTSETILLIMFFCIAFGFLYASIKIANSMGIAGAETSLHIFSEAKGMAQGFALSKVVDQIDSANEKSEDPKATTWQKRKARGLRLITGGEDGRQKLKKASDAGMGIFGKDHMAHAEHERKKRATRAIQVHNIGHTLELSDTPQNNLEKERAMRDASSAQLVEMIEHHHEQLIINNAGLLSDSQMAAIMKDEKIDDATKGKIAAKRGEQTQARLIANNTPRGGATPAFSAVIGKADVSDLKAMGYETAKTNAGYLTTKQIDDWKDLTSTEKSQLKKAREDELTSTFNNGTGADIILDRFKSDEERSKLPKEILMNLAERVDPGQTPLLNTNILAKIVDNNGITDTNRADIKNKVMDTLTTLGLAPGDKIYDKYHNFFEKNNAGQRY